MQEIFGEKDVFTVQVGARQLSACLKENLRYPIADGEKAHISYEIIPYNQEKKDGSVGEIKIMIAKRLIFLRKFDLNEVL